MKTVCKNEKIVKNIIDVKNLECDIQHFNDGEEKPRTYFKFAEKYGLKRS